ncbi:MAG: hypothetical protein QOD77_1442 [Thermoplasmata archaeon]|nr:hypothetical protein [Thermoplasmata archaeon]
MEAAFALPLWDESLGEGIEELQFKTLREMGFQAIDSVSSYSRLSFLMDPHKFVQTNLISEACTVFHHIGPLQEIDPRVWIDEAFRDAEERARMRAPHASIPTPSSTLSSVPSPEPIPPVRGAFLPANIRIGKVESNRLSDWYWPRDQDSFPGVLVFRGQLGGLAVMATHNGFIGIETPDEAAAHRWFNFVMAGLLREGLPAAIVRNRDLASVYPPPDSSPSWGGSYPSNGRRGRDAFAQHRVTNQEFERVLCHAEELSRMAYADKIPLFLEALTHLESQEAAQSFLFSWSIIETKLAEIWQAFLASKGVSNRRREKLEGTDWDVDVRCEVLQLAGMLQAELFEQLRPIRGIRNKFAHGDPTVTEGQGRQALDLAETLLVGDGPRLRGLPQPTPNDPFFLL